MKDDDENANSMAELLTVIGIDFSMDENSWFHSFVSKLYDDDDDGYLTFFLQFTHCTWISGAHLFAINLHRKFIYTLCWLRRTFKRIRMEWNMRNAAKLPTSGELAWNTP